MWPIALQGWLILFISEILYETNHSYTYDKEGQKGKFKRNNNFPFVVSKAILKYYLIEHLNKPMIKLANI